MTGNYDFANPETIDRLPVRFEPHWHVLQFCRHIGVVKRSTRPIGWIARFRTKPGGYRQYHLGPVAYGGSDGLTYDQALVAAGSWFSQPENASDASDPYPKGSKSGLDYCPWGDVFTVGHAMRDFIEWKRIAATKDTFDSLLSMINYYILPAVGQLSLSEFNGDAAKRFTMDVLETAPKRGNQAQGPRRPVQSLTEEELRNRKSKVNTLIGILRTGFRMAWENRATDDDRAWRSLRRLPNRARPRLLYLDREECRKLLGHCRKDLRDLVLAALYTGCRVSELERLKVDDVAKEVFGLYVDANKSGPPRYVFLPDEGMAFFLNLAAGRPKGEPILLHQDGQDWRGRYKHLFRAAIREAGIPERFVFHGLRHTYASQLVEAGTPLIVVAQQLGHATADTVARTYGHLGPQIRELQVRRNFSPIVPEEVTAITEPSKLHLEQLAETTARSDWRSYAQIDDQGSWPKSNFGRNGFWDERRDRKS